MSKPHDPKLVAAVDLLLKTAIEKGSFYWHIDDLYEPFRGVSNWLRGALESFQVAIEACRTCDTPFAVAMDFALDHEASIEETGVSSLEELENAFDHGTTGTPPELYLWGPKCHDLQYVRQFIAINSLPQLFSHVEWYYEVSIVDRVDTHRAVWMIVDARFVSAAR